MGRRRKRDYGFLFSIRGEIVPGTRVRCATESGTPVEQDAKAILMFSSFRLANSIQVAQPRAPLLSIFLSFIFLSTQAAPKRFDRKIDDIKMRAV